MVTLLRDHARAPKRNMVTQQRGTCLAWAPAKGAVPFSRFCEKGTVPFATPEKGTAPVSIQPETGAAPFSSPR